MTVDIKISGKNLLKWSHMEDWVNGASAAPTEHTLSGAGSSVARESTIIKVGTYSAKITRAGTDCKIYYDLPEYASYLGRKMIFGCWVYATVASRARLSIDDSVTPVYSSYHTGGSSWEFLTVTIDVDAAATRIRVGMEVNTGNTSAYFDGGILCEGSLAFIDLASSTNPYAESYDFSRKYRNSKFVVARRSGILVPSVDYGEKTLTIKGKVAGTTQATARTNWDSFLQYINDGEKDIYLYDDRFVKGYLVNESHNYIAALRIIDFNLQFLIQSPFNYYNQKLRTSQVISSSPTTFAVTNNGNVFSKPVLNFTAGSVPISSLLFQNITTGETLTFSGTVAAYTTLVIDCELFTVMNNSVDSIANFNGDFMKLNPGANNMKFTGTTLATVKVDNWDRWL
jgi:phage-related protein